MNINALSAGAAVAGGAIGAGTVVAGSKLYQKATGKPAGVYGSLAHVISNPNVEDKKGCFGSIMKEQAKDTLKLGGITVGTAATASLITGNSRTAQSVLHEAKSIAGECLEAIKINDVNLKEAVKNSKIYTKLNALPTAAKAGIAAGAAVLALAAPLVSLVSAAKSGAIEAQHEVK